MKYYEETQQKGILPLPLSALYPYIPFSSHDGCMMVSNVIFSFEFLNVIISQMLVCWLYVHIYMLFVHVTA